MCCKFLSYSSDAKQELSRLWQRYDMEILNISMDSGRRFVVHDAAVWKALYTLRYHMYVILEETSLKYASPLVYYAITGQMVVVSKKKYGKSGM